MDKQKASETEIINGCRRIIHLYEARGLKVAQLNCDNEFECIEDIVRPTRMHLVGANEHVGDVERSVRTTINECTRCHVHRLPYEYYSKLMV